MDGWVNGWEDGMNEWMVGGRMHGWVGDGGLVGR